MKHTTSYNQKKVLITGGAGFIGSHLAEALVQAGAQVTILDDFSTGSLDNLASIKNKLTLIAGSVTDQEVCIKAARKCDIIFHLAAVSSVHQAQEDPDYCYAVNIQGSYNILKSAVVNKCQKVVCASSAAVYGNKEGLLSEELPCSPLSAYGFSKYMMEEWCTWFAKHHTLNTTCLRYFNVFGPRQRGDLPSSSIIAQMNYRMQRNLPITIFGDGNQTRDFVPVATIVDANIYAGLAQDFAGQCINVATGVKKSINEMVEEVRKEYPLFSAPITYTDARENDIQHSCGTTFLYTKMLNPALENR